MPTRSTRSPRPVILAAAAGALALASCGREDAPDLVNGKELFAERCGSCHVLDRAGTAGTVGPNLDAAFGPSRRVGIREDTVEGIVRRQIDQPLRGSQMPPDLVTGDDARDVAAYVAQAAGIPGEDTGRLAQVGPAGATGGRQIFTAAGCNACHTLSDAGSQSDVGPNLDELAANARTRQPDAAPDEYVLEAIVDPQAFVVEGFPSGLMPTGYREQLSREQLDALVEYLLRVGRR